MENSRRSTMRRMRGGGMLVLPAAALHLVMIFAAAQPHTPTPVGSSYGGSQYADDPTRPHDYARFASVQRHCNDVLSSAAKITFDARRANAILQELSFARAEWRQEPGDAPLMPFDGSDVQGHAFVHAPAALATFVLTHFDVAHRSAGVNAVNVSAVVGIGISRNGTAPQIGRYASPEFKNFPGSSDMTLLFEGVYTESSSNGGEHVLCLLGSAMRPKRNDGHTFPNTKQPPVFEDDQIRLTLRYPKTFTLTARAIRGEMTSLNDKASPAYFDRLYLSSQLGAYYNYQFGSESLVAAACKPYPHEDAVMKQRTPLYKGDALCALLDNYIGDEPFDVVPNWNCDGDAAFCANIGPFKLGKQEKNGSFGNVRLRIQDVRCEPTKEPNNEFSVKASMVLRAVLPYDATLGRRTGLSGLTLAAEGVWRSSAGQLCMVGCLGAGDAECGSRVCLYVPTQFTITRRSVLFGTITSIDGSAHFPLTFEKKTHPTELMVRYSGSPVTAYGFSRTGLAVALLQRSEPFNFASVIAKSLLSYPRKDGVSGNDSLDLSDLANDLTLHVPAVPDPLPGGRFEKSMLYLEVFSIDSLVGRVYRSPGPADENPAASAGGRASADDKMRVLNVSAELAIMTMSYANASTYFLEGVYNPIDGRMYLVGCRDVRSFGRAVAESKEYIENGMDCAIEAKVEYPPTTARWLINPTAKIWISSKRSADDQLYFNSTGFMTLPILYRQQRQDILSRRGVEAVLRMLTLTFAIACTVKQLLYIKSNSAAVPYVSLVMLGVQAVGYSIPLVTGAEALFARMTSEPDGPPSYEIANGQIYWTIDCIVKLLVLFAFLLTLRLAQKVWRSRIRLLSRAPLEPHRVPNDKKVFLVTLSAHAVGFTVVLIVYYVGVLSRPIRQADAYMDSTGKTHKLHEWAMQLQEYTGLAQDFFLVPQIVGNYLWRVNCKALLKSYYVGITAARVLPHLYDYIRAPSINPYFSEEYEFANTSLDFYSRFGDVAISVIAVLLAVLVYVQQRWSYKIISKTVKSGQKKLQHLGSRVYERLPSMSSMSFEAELVGGVNEAAAIVDGDELTNGN